MKRLLIGLAALPAFAAPAVALADQAGQYDGPHMWHGGWSGWFFGPVMMLVFLAAAVAVVVLVVRWLGSAGHGPAAHPPAPPGKTPLDILKERFARGEIDRQEFEDRRDALGE